MMTLRLDYIKDNDYGYTYYDDTTVLLGLYFYPSKYIRSVNPYPSNIVFVCRKVIKT